MMDDLIRRQGAIDAIDKDIMGGLNYERILREVPSAEPEQKTGKWEWVQYDSISELGDWHCSECGFMPAAFNLAKKHLNYCPSCGAYMRGEEE